ncbi:MAG: hypothetical protein AAB468_00105 [Patescibacteria group bacterium]
MINRLAISPAKIEVEVAPGAQTTVPIFLLNPSAEPVTVRVSAEDVVGGTSAAADGEVIKLLATDGSPYSLKSYLSFSTREVSLAPGEQVALPVTVSLPAGAPAGGLYGAVLFSFGAPTGGAPAQVVNRLASLFFVRTGVATAPNSELIGFKLITREPLAFALTVENSGNIYLNPYGLITITNRLTGRERFVKLDPWFVLPGATRFREVTGLELPLGFYHATAEVNRGYEDIIDTRSINFYLLPATSTLVLAGLALICLSVFIIVWLKKRRV